METIEISVSTRNNWWVTRQVQGTYRLERLLNHIFSVLPSFILLLHWEIHVDAYATFRGHMQVSRRG